MVGKIEKVALREIWKHEAYDFSSWLVNNLDTLEQVLDFEIVNPTAEHGTANFSVDIVAQDEDGNMVVIENQLEKSNHDHLGKLITYLSAVGAQKAIWIVSEPRQEHIKAISWLNESELATFYLIKVEGIKIGDSAPAPLFTLIVGPSEEVREAGETKKNYSERHGEVKEFWTFLLNKAKKKTKMHSNLSPTMHNWLGTSAGFSGLNFNYAVGQHEGKVELYIDRGRQSGEMNQKLLEILLQNREEIETAFGEPLEWDSLEGRRACRIAKYYTIGGYRDKDNWELIVDSMIDGMVKLAAAIEPVKGKIRDYIESAL